MYPYRAASHHGRDDRQRPTRRPSPSHRHHLPPTSSNFSGPNANATRQNGSPPHHGRFHCNDSTDRHHYSSNDRHSTERLSLQQRRRNEDNHRSFNYDRNHRWSERSPEKQRCYNQDDRAFHYNRHSNATPRNDYEDSTHYARYRNNGNEYLEQDLGNSLPQGTADGHVPTSRPGYEGTNFLKLLSQGIADGHVPTRRPGYDGNDSGATISQGSADGHVPTQQPGYWTYHLNGPVPTNVSNGHVPARFQTSIENPTIPPLAQASCPPISTDASVSLPSFPVPLATSAPVLLIDDSVSSSDPSLLFSASSKLNESTPAISHMATSPTTPIPCNPTKPIPRKRNRSSSSSPSTTTDTKRKREAPVLTLFGESEFDLLADSDDNISSNKYVIDVDDSDDELEGHDGEWLEMAVAPTVMATLSSSIDFSKPKCKLVLEDIPILFQGPEDATKVDRYFVIERRSDSMSPVDETSAGMTPGIQGIECWRRGDYGCGLRSVLDRCPHYDQPLSGFKLLKRIAQRRQVPFEFYAKGTYRQDQGVHKLYLSNEDLFKSKIAALELESIFDDMIVESHPNDCTKMKIAARNKRGNRGVSLGFTSGHSTKRNASTGISEPTIVEDTWRYLPVAIKFSKLQKMMSNDAGFPLFDSTLFKNRSSEWAEQMDEEMINELFSLLFLVHDDPKSQAFNDWLQKHCDQQNCPHWSILGFAWKTFFCKQIGRYVTAVITSNWKKSISDVYNREDVIGSAAEYIVDRYRKTEDYLRIVTSDTLCQDDHGSPYRVIPIHRDPFVHLSPVLYSVDRLRRFLLSELGVKMSVYLRDEMIVSSLLETNNMFRFSKFAKKHYDYWVTEGEDPIPLGSTFIDSFQVWLRTEYSANEGNHTRSNEREGVVRYVCCRNTPTLVSTSQNNVKFFNMEMNAAARRNVTEVDYRKTLSRLEKEMDRVGCLKIQKMIYARTVLGNDMSMGWINFCLPGSPRHMSRLQEAGYALTNKNQVDQVTKAVAARANLPLPVAEESVCSILKPASSNSVFKEMTVKGEDLYSCRLNDNGVVEVVVMDATTMQSSRLYRGGFSYGNGAHYRPPWSRSKGTVGVGPMKVRFSSDENMKFNVRPKSGRTQRKQMEDETVASMQYDISRKDIQLLLNKNRSLVVDLELVASVFFIDEPTLRAAIRVEVTGNGHLAFVDERVFKKKEKRGKLHRIKQLDQVSGDRCPAFDQIDNGECLAYGSKSTAVLSLLLHLLFNVRRKGGSSWTFRKLKNTKELVIVVPVSKNKTTLEVVGALFRADNKVGTKIFCRYFDKNAVACPAIEVASDLDGYFEDKFNEE